jgi:hypothetical protein
MRNAIICAATILAGVATVYQGSATSSSASTLLKNPMAATAAAAQKVKTITVPAGTRVLIRMVDAIDSSKQKAASR